MQDNMPDMATTNTSMQTDDTVKIKRKLKLMYFVSLLLLAVSFIFGAFYIQEKQAPVATEEPEAITEQVEYQPAMMKKSLGSIPLPSPTLDGNVSLEEAIQNRRSRRAFAEESVSLTDLSQILWAGQGITDDQGHRSAPSAKSAYPYSLYVVARNVADLNAGFYRYSPQDNALEDLGVADAGTLLKSAGVQPGAVDAPVVVLLVAEPAKMVEMFPDADPMENVYLEGGHIGQNLYLQAEALNMSMVVMGGFDSSKVIEALNLDKNQVVVYVVPLGNRTVEVSQEH